MRWNKGHEDAEKGTKRVYQQYVAFKTLLFVFNRKPNTPYCDLDASIQAESFKWFIPVTIWLTIKYLINTISIDDIFLLIDDVNPSRSLLCEAEQRSVAKQEWQFGRRVEAAKSSTSF